LATKLYWDTTVFLCFLNPAEENRRRICDILRHARTGDCRIYTSTYTIVETVRPKKVSIPNARLLTPAEIDEIEKMFRWSWVEKVPLDQAVAFRSVELARDYALASADAVHAASAIRAQVDQLQAWDRDFSPIGHLVVVCEPQQISPQMDLIEPPAIGPVPSAFKPRP
jgi:predicted nucleic acid-binding protein